MEVKAKTVGIIGGMGPEATLDLFYKIIKATPVKKDQDHIHIIIDNFPQIPDRTAFLLGKVYHKVFEVEGYKIITPSEEKQNEVMKIIYSIKAGKIEENVQTFEEIIEHMKFLGSELIVLGCTELPILLKYFKPSIPLVDVTSCLAKEVVNFATGR